MLGPNIKIIGEGSVVNSGRVSVTVDGEEGRVCGKGWGKMEAVTTCRQLGFRSGSPLL